MGAADVDVFAALASPVRRAILTRLRSGPLTVNEIADGFEIGRPAISEHLQGLRKARLVREEPIGRERHYHLDPRPLTAVDQWLKGFRRSWDERIAEIDRLDAKG
jgi:DNA-binding transcriptional ArsR family regulator